MERADEEARALRLEADWAAAEQQALKRAVSETEGQLAAAEARAAAAEAAAADWDSQASVFASREAHLTGLLEAAERRRIAAEADAAECRSALEGATEERTRSVVSAQLLAMSEAGLRSSLAAAEASWSAAAAEVESLGASLRQEAARAAELEAARVSLMGEVAQAQQALTSATEQHARVLGRCPMLYKCERS